MFSQFERLAYDEDMQVLRLDMKMVMRKIVLQMYSLDTVHLSKPRANIEISRIQLGYELQSGRWVATFDGSDAIAKVRPYTEGSREQIIKGMQQLCGLLEMAPGENFHLPLPSGIYEIAAGGLDKLALYLRQILLEHKKVARSGPSHAFFPRTISRNRLASKCRLWKQESNCHSA